MLSKPEMHDPETVAKRYIQMGQNLQTTGLMKDALQYYEKSVDLFPSTGAYMHMAWLYMLENNTDKAIELCEMGLGLDDNNACTYNDLGFYHIQKNDFETARIHLKKAVSINPLFAAPIYNLGVIAEMRGDWIEAIVYYAKCSELDPSNSEFIDAYYKLLVCIN